MHFADLATGANASLVAFPMIDSHQHYWSVTYADYEWLTPELGPLYRDFGPNHLAPLLLETGIDATVLIQAAPAVNETKRLLQIADRERTVAGVVGWVPLERHNVRETLCRLAKHRKFLGIRPMLQDIEDIEWINRNGVQRGLRTLVGFGLTLDALVRPHHLPGLLRTVDANPDLRIVIDHGAKPNIRAGDFEPWASRMQTLAQHPHVFCKLSGLLTEAGENKNTQALRPYVQHLLETFGAHRLMWGSDWPVLESVGTYGAWFRMSHELLNDANETELRSIFGDTARNFYGLTD